MCGLVVTIPFYLLSVQLLLWAAHVLSRNCCYFLFSPCGKLIPYSILFCFVSKQGKQQQSLSHSPKTKMTGFSVATGQGSPSDSAGLNRWFKPEVDTPSSIRSIQIEEKAMKDLKRFYSSVKIVKNQS